MQAHTSHNLTWPFLLTRTLVGLTSKSTFESLHCKAKQSVPRCMTESSSLRNFRPRVICIKVNHHNARTTNGFCDSRDYWFGYTRTIQFIQWTSIHVLIVDRNDTKNQGSTYFHAHVHCRFNKEGAIEIHNIRRATFVKHIQFEQNMMKGTFAYFQSNLLQSSSKRSKSGKHVRTFIAIVAFVSRW